MSPTGSVTVVRSHLTCYPHAEPDEQHVEPQDAGDDQCEDVGHGVPPRADERPRRRVAGRTICRWALRPIARPWPEAMAERSLAASVALRSATRNRASGCGAVWSRRASARSASDLATVPVSCQQRTIGPNLGGHYGRPLPATPSTVACPLDGGEGRRTERCQRVVPRTTTSVGGAAHRALALSKRKYLREGRPDDDGPGSALRAPSRRAVAARGSRGRAGRGRRRF